MPRTEAANQRLRETQREKILDAAKRVFARKGLSATMADIAAEATISHGLAYHYFTSKEALLQALVEHTLQERRPERDGSLRILYAARIGHCRACPLRAQCQESSTTQKPRRVSAVLKPLSSPHTASSPPPDPASALLAFAPVFWRDWPRCSIRRTWLKVVRSQTTCLEISAPLPPSCAETPTEKVMTRAERAHWRLSWDQRLARNARPVTAPQLVVTLHGLPATFAAAFGFDLLATA